ncbi:MAG: nucleotidyltransferase family protein [Bacteroidia bacterium]|nr:nucleotidyltransferase family protein [Bacteroidia bacterium]
MLTKELILSTLKTHKPEFTKFGVKDIGLFGSFVRTEQSNESDIDILIDFNTLSDENFDNFMAVCDAFDRIFENVKVDVVTKNGLSPHIGPKILKETLFV